MNAAVFPVLLIALLLGIVAGLRSLITPAVVSWVVHLGWFNVERTWAAALGNLWVRWILTALGVVELIADQLPATPSRTVAWQFGLRLFVGALCGAVVGTASRLTLAGALAGSIGAVIGTLAGRAGDPGQLRVAHGSRRRNCSCSGGSHVLRSRRSEDPRFAVQIARQRQHVEAVMAALVTVPGSKALGAKLATEEAKLLALEAERTAASNERPKVMPHPALIGFACFPTSTATG
ncbi:MAG TPA: DUF4126 family protein [Polyangia bacterium]|nr:DUF4126 family protein [Polyangia bacterium]